MKQNKQSRRVRKASRWGAVHTGGQGSEGSRRASCADIGVRVLGRRQEYVITTPAASHCLSSLL